MPIRKARKRKPKRGGQYTTMPVKPKRGLKPKGPKSARGPKRRKPIPKRKGRFTTMPVIKEFV